MEAQDREMLVRIDERTLSIVQWQTKHEKQDRQDFKEVHKRINRVNTKQNIILTVGAAIGAIGGWLGKVFTSGGA